MIKTVSVSEYNTFFVHLQSMYIFGNYNCAIFKLSVWDAVHMRFYCDVIWKVFSCWEYCKCAGKHFPGVETWVTIQASCKQQITVRKSFVYCSGMFACVCGLWCVYMHFWSWSNMTIPMYLSGILREPNNEYLLNTLNELSSGSPQRGILEKEDKSPLPMLNGMSKTHMRQWYTIQDIKWPLS